MQAYCVHVIKFLFLFLAKQSPDDKGDSNQQDPACRQQRLHSQVCTRHRDNRVLNNGRDWSITWGCIARWWGARWGARGRTYYRR
jgi:hypothetical protein